MIYDACLLKKKFITVTVKMIYSFQMFGSVATMLDMTSKESGMIDCRKVSVLLSLYPLEYA